MKSAPNSRVNLDRGIERFAGNFVAANRLRVEMANAIVAHLIGDGVVKGGSGLKFRYGDGATRFTMDLDTARRGDLGAFLANLSGKLAAGWNGFTGAVLVKPQASPEGIPFEYVMQPCDVKLSYKGAPWFTVRLEIGCNEIGDADEPDMVTPPGEIGEIFEFLRIPIPARLPVMRLEYQVAQKLHGLSAPRSRRAHDLIDLQLIFSRSEVDLRAAAMICRRLFAYRKCHAWPPVVVKGEFWVEEYDSRRGDLTILPTVDQAIEWVNDLIHRLDATVG